MRVRIDPQLYAEHWEKESAQFESKGVYRLLSDITPDGHVLEIGSGIGLATLELAASRKVLALDSNVHLVEKARSRLLAAGANAQIIVADIFEPSGQCLEAIREFAPKVIVGWFLGSNADDQEKYVDANVPENERAKQYRENVEDALLARDICLPSVEWVHLVNRSGVIAGVDEAFAAVEAKKDYDTYVFLQHGFEVVEVQFFDWDTSDSTFQYGSAPNPILLPGQPIPKIVSVLAKRKVK